MRIVRSLIPAFLVMGSMAPAAVAQAPAAVAPAPVSMGAPATTGPGGAPRSFSALTARLTPTVVNVSTTQKVEVGKFPKLTPGTPLEELFKRFQEQQGADGEAVTREATSLGSGFLISADGYVVTNNHVISGGDPRNGEPKTIVDSITVTLSD
ncbi:MAG: protease, partial [Polymorphobacter sp.]